MQTNVIREVTIRARAEGVQQATAALQAMDSAHRDLATSANSVGMATDTMARRQQSAASSLRRVENQLDGEAKAARALGAQLRDLQRARDQALLSETRFQQLSTIAQTNYMSEIGRVQARQKMQAANGNSLIPSDSVKQIGLARHELQNLGQQAMDVGVMLQGGMSPLTTLVTQGPQIISVLAGSQGGIKGALTEIGETAISLATPMRLVAVGLAAAAGAAVYYGLKGDDSIKPLNELMEAHKRIIGEVAQSYGAAIDAQDSYASGATRAFDLRQSASELRLSARKSLLDNDFAGNERLRLGRTDEGGRTYEAREEFKAFEAPLVRLAEGLRNGTDNARAFVDEIATIAEQHPANKTIQDLAKELIDLAKPAADAAARLDALALAQARLARSRFNDAIGDIRSFIPDKRSDRDKIEEGYNGAMSKARTEAQERAAQDARLGALREVERQEDVIRAGHALDLRNVTARTVAEKSAIAAERERLALSGSSLSLAQQEERVQAQVSLVIAEANEAARQNYLGRTRAQEDMISGLQLELYTVGATVCGDAGVNVFAQLVAEGAV